MSKRSQILTALRVTLVAMCATAVYETTKLIFVPRVSLLTSHIITTFFAGCVGFCISLRTLLRLGSCRSSAPSHKRPRIRAKWRFSQSVKAREAWLGRLFLLIIFLGRPGFILAASGGLDPHRNIGQYGHKIWTSQTGVPGEAVYQIVQTIDGYLWLRTSAGLVQFDGVRFVRIDASLDNSPLRESVRAICKTRDGHLLVRGPSETLVYRAGRFDRLFSPAALPDGTVRVVAQSSDGNVWIGADDFIFLARRDRVEMVRRGTSWIVSTLESRTGDLWFGGLRGLMRYTGDRLTFEVLTRDGATALLEDGEGGLWVGTQKGLYRLVPGRFQLNAQSQVLAGNEITALAEDRQGNVWVGTNGQGLLRFTNHKWSSFTSRDGLSDDHVHSIIQDREGNLWVGTANGLDRFQDTPVITLTSTEGLLSNDVTAVTEGAGGGIFVFSDGAGLTELRAGAVRQYKVADGLPAKFGASLYASADGSVWIGTEKGLGQWKDRRLRTFTAGGELLGQFISAISEDDQGLIIATSRTQVFRFKNDRLAEFTFDGRNTPLSKPGNYTFVIYRAPDTTLWFGTVKGLFRFTRGARPEQSLQRRVKFPVTSIFDDGAGYLWLGGRVPGITRFRIADGSIARYTSEQGLFDDIPTRILADRGGNLWISTSRGIFRVSRNELDNVSNGRLMRVHPTLYDVADGMKTGEASLPERQPAGWRLQSGLLLFTTRKGLVEIDPEHLPHHDSAPSVIVQSLAVDDDPATRISPVNVEKTTAGRLSINQPTEVHLPPGKGNLEFQFTTPSFIAPQKLQFRYQLQGFDKDWVDAGTRRIAYYTNIAPGTYRFKVTASNEDGVWNTTNASVGIYLAPHFYQTFWFYAVCVLTFGAAITTLHRVRVSGLNKREKVLARRIHERTADLQREIVEHKRSEEMLQNSENKYRVLFEDSADATWLMDERGFLNCNSAALQMFGYSSGTQMLHPADISPSHQPDGTTSRAAADQRIVAAFLNGKERFEWMHQRKNGNVFPADVCLTALTLSGRRMLLATVRDITDRKVAEKRIQSLAYSDALTGLPNRRLLQDRLTQALASARRRKDRVALLFFDLDRFKNINDSLGHSVGDLLLQEVAGRLTKWGREQDTVARVGGDEFLIVLTGLKDVTDAAVAAERLMDAMIGEYSIQGHALNLTGSLGISIFPEHGTDAETLIKNADTAMYSAKESGRNGFRFFTEDVNAQAVERLTLENSLQEALDKEELFLVYQPQVDMATGKIIGLEALLRWQHPELGLVPPDKFIRIAENCGLIVPIGEWVLRTACSQARKWQEDGLPPVRVAVNVSAVQFRRQGFSEQVGRMLHETGLGPQYLELELTESLLLANTEVTLSVIEKLKAMGLTLAIDDFGTGYSSFSYLKQFRVSRLKIDRSFIRDVAVNADDGAITAAIISMAKSLKLTVIAEGVEDEAQMTFLRAHQCDEVQGYYFSKPLAVDKVAEKLRGNALHALSANHGA